MDIVLALGGGGVKGISHLGVIRQLTLNGFNIKAIAGTSAGGLVGSLISAGYSVEQLVDMLNSLNQHHHNLYKRNPKDEPSILGLTGLVDVLQPKLSGITFDKLSIPFACTAVDLISGREIVIRSGQVLDAVLSTIAVPGVFPPKKIGNYLLVDGGIIDPVPVAVARWLAPGLPVFAVSLSTIKDDWNLETPIPPIDGTPIPTPVIEYFSNMRLGQAYKIIDRSFDIIALNTTQMKLQQSQPDAIILPDVHKYQVIQRIEVDELILIGEQAVNVSLKSLKKAFPLPKSLVRKFKKNALPENVIVI